MSKPRLYLYSDVLDEIRFNGQHRAKRMAFGLLVGLPFVDDEGDTFVEVEGFVAGTHLLDTVGFTQHLRTQWRAATAARRFHFPDAEVVGWYAAPYEDRTFGQDELVLHNSFFNADWHLGLWVPPGEEPLALSIEGEALQTRAVGIISPSV